MTNGSEATSGRVTGLTIDFGVPAEMRDGTVLVSDVAYPAGTGRWPTIVVRSPYEKSTWFGEGPCNIGTVAKQGFLVIVQDTRNRFASGGEGDYLPFVDDGPDGEDTVAWAAKHPRSSGDVFMMGMSYHGFTQWAAAVRRPPALRAISPVQAPSTPWRTLGYRGGVLELGALAGWHMGIGADVLMRRFRSNPPELGRHMARFMGTIISLADTGFQSLPIEKFAPLADNDIDRRYADFLKGTPLSPEPQGTALADAADYSKVEVPAYILGGWYDFFVQGSIDQYQAMRATAATPEARERTRLIMGPWTHGNQLPGIGERNFGPLASPMLVNGVGVPADMLNFFRQQISGEHPDIAPVKIFVMGANIWRDEQEWPLARTKFVPWYLSSGGAASAAPSDGGFSPEGASGHADSYVYDPADPVPVHGGTNLGGFELAGPRDQTRVEARADVAVYTSESLSEAIEVTGTVTAEIWIATDVVDTDLVVRLVDVQADGTPYNIADGILRARYRNSPDMDKPPIRLEPGQPTLMRVELTPTSNLFKPGHRLRVQVTSSSFPRWARNLNIWDQEGATLAEAQVAHISILHDDEHPSRLLLPVIPESGA